jgi:hypothetical protein
MGAWFAYETRKMKPKKGEEEILWSPISHKNRDDEEEMECGGGGSSIHGPPSIIQVLQAGF